MLLGLTVLLLCQLVGEVLSQALGLPVPGPVVGFAILFVGLCVRGGVGEPLDRAADGLLRDLSLLFVPAGVGVVQYLSLLGEEALPIGVALPASTLLTVVVTAWLMRLLWRDRRAPVAGGEVAR